jgi:hypothetical protein
VFKLGFREAVEGGMLCDYKVLIAAVRSSSAVDAAGLRTHTTRVGGKRVPAVMAAQLEALMQAIKCMQDDATLRAAATTAAASDDVDADAVAAAPPKIFTFHSSNDAALEFSQLVARELGHSPQHKCVWHVFGKHKGVSQPVKAREALLRKEFAVCEHVAVVCNCKALMEGVDVPCVNGVAFIDPKKSVVDIAQAMGRALRHSPGKGMAYVIIPLLLDEADCDALLKKRGSSVLLPPGEPDAAGSDAAVSPAADADGDEAMEDDADDVASDDAPQPAGAAKRSSSKRKRRDKKGVGAAEKHAPPACFATLLEVLSGVMQCDERLEGCIRSLRTAHGAGDMHHIRAAEEALSQRVAVVGDALGSMALSDVRRGVMLIVQDWLTDMWDERLGQLRAYKAAHSDCNVPTMGYKPNPQLGAWVGTQRRCKAAGKLLPERMERLDALGFAWSAREDFDDAWQQRFAELEAYTAVHGDCKVPRRYKPNPQLGAWVSVQRTLKAAGKLAKERAERLEAMGFELSAQDDAWQRRFAELEAYTAAYGDCIVPQRYKPNPQLGMWVSQQRKLKVAGKLAQVRVKRLEALGFAWSLC